MPAPALRILVALLAFALIGVGCGGDEVDQEKANYADSVEAVLGPLESSFDTLSTELSEAKTPAELDRRLSQAQRRIEAAGSELEAIDPPPEVGRIHQDLVVAVQAFAASIEPLEQAIADDDAEAIREAAGLLSRSSAGFRSQLAEITRRADDAGVPVGAGGQSSE